MPSTLRLSLLAVLLCLSQAITGCGGDMTAGNGLPPGARAVMDDPACVAPRCLEVTVP